MGSDRGGGCIKHRLGYKGVGTDTRDTFSLVF